MIHTILGVNIQDLTDSELESKLEGWLAGQEGHVIVTPNAEFLLHARKNPSFMSLLNQADLAVADSVSLQYAAVALSEHRLEHRVPGVDLLRGICALARERSVRVLLLGGASGSAEGAGRQLQEQYLGLDVTAIDPGHIPWNKDRLQISDGLIERLIDLDPDVVAVGLGQYKQEQFIAQVRHRLPGTKIWIGVGGAFEMLSGQKRRAPYWVSRVGLEWFWRLVIEPRRWRRIVNASIIFPSLVAWQAFRQGHFIRSCKRVFSEIIRQFSL